MKRISESEYWRAFDAFKRRKPQDWPRYAAAGAEQTLMDYMVEQQQPASETTVELSIATLYQKGSLTRVDGKTPVHDARQNLQQVLVKVGAAPLTASEIESFGSLHPQVLAEKYWTDYPNGFSVRYDRAIREAGFQQPGRLAPVETDGGEISLTADDYHKMSADQVKKLLRTPKGKMAIYALIKAGKI